MTDPCLPIQELLALVEETPPDPRIAHVRTCPRCRSLLAAAQGFATRDRGEACPGEGGAVPRIHSILEQHILGAQGVAARSENRPAVPPTAGGPTGRERIGWLLRLAAGPRLLLPAIGAAAILVGGVLLVRPELPWPSGPPALREEPGISSDVNLVPLPSRVLGGGEIELRWRRSATAEAYRVRFFDAEMREIAGLSAGAETLLVVPVSVSGGPAAPFFWQVEALSRGDKIGDSAPLRWGAAQGR